MVKSTFYEHKIKALRTHTPNYKVWNDPVCSHCQDTNNEEVYWPCVTLARFGVKLVDGIPDTCPEGHNTVDILGGSFKCWECWYIEHPRDRPIHQRN